MSAVESSLTARTDSVTDYFKCCNYVVPVATPLVKEVIVVLVLALVAILIVNPFHATFLSIYPLKTWNKLDFFRGYRKKPVAWNRLTTVAVVVMIVGVVVVVVVLVVAVVVVVVVAVVVVVVRSSSSGSSSRSSSRRSSSKSCREV